MKSFYYSLLLALCILTGCKNNKKSSITIQNLQCEYLVNPLGIDALRPRLSWELYSEKNGQRQTAYQIMVSNDSMSLLKGKAGLWNSEKVRSYGTNQIAYKGDSLISGEYCYWKVRIWDENGNVSPWSTIAHWSMGLLHPNDWKSKWIGAPPDTTTILYPIHPHNGFHSRFATKADTPKWVSIDLGKIQKINEIKLFPTHPYDLDIAGYLFPVKFRIDISNNKDFKQFKTIIDETKHHVSNPGSKVWREKITPVNARYVRLWVTQLAKRNAHQYAFSLAEMQVLHDGENVALHAPVAASDFLVADNGAWDKYHLTDSFTRSSIMPEMESSPPSPLLRKEFKLSGKIKRAYLYISALGLYEMYINGKRVGNRILAPEWTDYRKRAQYQTYDVTSFLKNGENVMGAILADGWYIGPLMTNPQRGTYGINRRLIAQLEIEKNDGGKEIITTDSSWKIDPNGPVRSASIYNGETYNGYKAEHGWNTPDYDVKKNAAKWHPVTVDTSIHITLSAQMDQPIKINRTLKPVRIIHPKPGIYIFDLGQNMAGWCRLHLPQYSGQQIVLHHGEMLKKDSTLYTANLRGAKQVDSFMAPPGPVTFEAKFTYHGFRYVSVTGLHHKPNLSMLTAEVIGTSNPQTGTFSCSDSLLNKLWNNILWTQWSNTMGVPTDCPQRDERMGWMGDAQVFSQTAIFNMGMAAFYTKWMRDIRDGQLPDGRIPDFSPQLNSADAFYNAPAWADAAVIIPWRLYINYGDKRILKEQYKTLKKYNAFITKMNPDFIWGKGTGNNYSDWLNGDNVISTDYPKKGGAVPANVFSTAFYYHSTLLISKMATVLGKEKDAQFYQKLADNIKRVFNKQFVSKNGIIKGNTQAGYALALRFHLLPDSLQPLAVKNMITNIRQYDNRMSTGIQSTIRMMGALVKWGYADIAYQLLESHRLPSWIYSIDQGATTIWERWDGYVKGRGFQNPGMNSFNHYAFGAIGQWMYQHIIGIQPDTLHPGYRHFIIHPIPGGHLTWAKGSYHSINGLIVSNWALKGKQFTLHIQIPVNTTATVYLPLLGSKHRENTKGIKFLRYEKGNAVYLAQSGKYTLKNF